MILHAGCVARRRRGGWAGVLLSGPSGAGKSDLALRLLARGWRLVADDRARIWMSGGALYAKAPDVLAGLIEVRGLDVLPLSRIPLAPVRLFVDCRPVEEPLERLPEPETASLGGVGVPRLALRALDGSSPLKVELALGRALARVASAL